MKNKFESKNPTHISNRSDQPPMILRDIEQSMNRQRTFYMKLSSLKPRLKEGNRIKRRMKLQIFIDMNKRQRKVFFIYAVIYNSTIKPFESRNGEFSQRLIVVVIDWKK
ncbi:CLUMA_CG000555, isoform A [Clunio marinus]|uniref:CLUMA_CG000555, isoform A n=1 Tax=Clunio marinus TaxID=568069 RepID=A0A1J1HGP3_9DIPT|nr:CLUMA_CG000555, isoform A [Clunio marinus]